MYQSQIADRFQVRLPDGLRTAIKIAAARNKRSMNAEIVYHLEKVFTENEKAGGPLTA